MLRQILVGMVGAGAFAALLALAGCGQKGALFLPREPAAAGRATLPEAARSSLPGGGGGAGDNSPAPALPAPAARVVAPTPAASTPPSPAVPAAGAVR